MALRKIHNRYYVYFRDIDGTIRTRSLKVSDKDMAEKLHRQFMLKLQAKKGSLVIMQNFPEQFPRDQVEIKSIAPEIPVTPGEHQRGGIAIAKMFDLALTRRELSLTHKKRWNTFEKNIGVKYADQVTPQKALQYLETHYNKGNGKTFNNVKSILNTIFRCCLVEAGLQQSPFEVIINRRVTDIEHHRNLTLDEVDRIMEAPGIPEYIRIMTMLSRWTTQRLETCARMTPEMFDFDRKVFIIDPGKTKRFKKWVCCPIMPELEKFIKPVLAKCKHVDQPIVKQFNYPAKNDYFSAEFRELLISLGICDGAREKASFHSLRGTAITWFKEHGVTGDILRSITGHETQDIEDIYARAIANVSQVAKGECV
jgi:integrase